MHKITRRVTIALAAAGAALALAAAPAAMASPACGTNCTNATLAVGSTIGTTGFPTSVSLSGQAGQTASATATGYSVFSNVSWTLSWGPDTDDQITTGGAAVWHIGTGPGVPAFNIAGTTSLGHAGTSFPVTASSGNPNGLAPMVIGTGGPTGGGQNYMDTYSVAIPSTAAPGSFVSDYDYTLSAS